MGVFRLEYKKELQNLEEGQDIEILSEAEFLDRFYNGYYFPERDTRF